MTNSKIIVLSLCAIISLGALIGCGTRELPGAESNANADVSNTSAVETKENVVTSSTSKTTPTLLIFTKATTTAASTTSKRTTTTEKVTTTTSTATSKTTALQTTTAQNVSSAEELSFSMVAGSSWESNGKTVYQYDCTINNNSQTTLSSWSITVPLSDTSAELLQGWNAKYSISNNSLVITPDEYNAEIAPNSTFSLGFQIASNGNIDVTQAQLSANNMTINPTT